MAETEKKQEEVLTRENQIAEQRAFSRPPREGSTRLPPFPMVHIVKPKIARKSKITYDQVPELRKEMKERLFRIDRKEKFNNDFKRTSQDFWRMGLDQLTKISDSNRLHMADAIKIYLGQTDGSRKAIEPLVKIIAP